MNEFGNYDHTHMIRLPSSALVSGRCDLKGGSREKCTKLLRKRTGIPKGAQVHPTLKISGAHDDP